MERVSTKRQDERWDIFLALNILISSSEVSIMSRKIDRSSDITGSHKSHKQHYEVLSIVKVMSICSCDSLMPMNCTEQILVCKYYASLTQALVVIIRKYVIVCEKRILWDDGGQYYRQRLNTRTRSGYITSLDIPYNSSRTLDLSFESCQSPFKLFIQLPSFSLPTITDFSDNMMLQIT